MQEGGVVRGRMKGSLGRISGGCRHDIDLGAKAQLFDDLAPLPRLRKNAQPHMAHLGFPPNGEGAPGKRDGASAISRNRAYLILPGKPNPVLKSLPALPHVAAVIHAI